jgi:reversibly glycosylated polypeptide
MTPTDPIVAVCVPTARADAIHDFLDAWRALWREPVVDVRLFVHEDNPSATFSANGSGARVHHTCQADIARELGDAAWIIPMRSGASRSFPMYLAWKAGCDYIITLDDDCYPPPDGARAFVEAHLAAFSRDRWFRTIAGDEPRGVPYERLGRLTVALNHGLWSDVPDLDGPTSLVRMREPRAAVLPRGHDVVPPGMAFPLCAMNVCYHRSVIPAAYNLLMGLDAVGLDRFDDIWSGLFLKRILDYMGWYATSGEPFIRHMKRSNRFTNLRREALGIEIHEQFWDYVLDAPLAPALTVTQAFKALAEHVRFFPDSRPDVPSPGGYFRRLADAMITWADLFER